MKPQTASVLDLLRRKPEGVTSLDALDAIGTFRLAARIEELRHDGYNVYSEYLTTPRGKRIVRYVLLETVQLVVGL